MRMTAATTRVTADAAACDDDERSRTVLDSLYRAEVPALARGLRRRSPRPDDVVDLIHDAFVRLLGLSGARLAALNRQQPAAYLNRTVRNIAIDGARHDQRQSATAHVPIGDLALAGADPHAMLEARDNLRRVEQALLGLRPRTRAIYIAHRVQGMSYDEIADVCGITVKGVEKQMSRAIAALDRRLGCDHDRR